jgi:hypothetical protein
MATATAEEFANQIMTRTASRQCAPTKEAILDIVGRTIDDTQRVEILNADASVGDFSEVNAML